MACWIARRLLCARLTRALRSCVSCSQPINSSRVHSRCGNNSRTTRLTWGRVIGGIFFPPVLLHLQQERSRQQRHRQVVIPAHPTPHLVLHQARFTLFHLELGLAAPARRPNLPQLHQRRIHRRV